jgi:hypothetical protein
MENLTSVPPGICSKRLQKQKDDYGKKDIRKYCRENLTWICFSYFFKLKMFTYQSKYKLSIFVPYLILVCLPRAIII